MLCFINLSMLVNSLHAGLFNDKYSGGVVFVLRAISCVPDVEEMLMHRNGIWMTLVMALVLKLGIILNLCGLKTRISWVAQNISIVQPCISESQPWLSSLAAHSHSELPLATGISPAQCLSALAFMKRGTRGRRWYFPLWMKTIISGHTQRRGSVRTSTCVGALRSCPVRAPAVRSEFWAPCHSWTWKW